MASDDFEVLAFKILSYLYRCMKNGKKVDIAALRQLVGCNEAYFGAVARSLQSKGYVEGFVFDGFSGVVIDSPSLAAMSDPAITMDGSDIRGRELAHAQGRGFRRARIRRRPLRIGPGRRVAHLTRGRRGKQT